MEEGEDLRGPEENGMKEGAEGERRQRERKCERTEEKVERGRKRQ